MKKLLHVLLLLAGGHVAGGQAIVFEKGFDLRAGFSDKRETYPVWNLKDSTVSLFVVDYFAVHGLLFDRNYNLVSEIDAERPAAGAMNLLGSNISDGVYNIFLSTSNGLTSISCDYTRQTITQNQIALPLKRENFAAGISHENKFYLLATERGSSTLKLYVFQNAMAYQSRAYEFDNESFASSSMIITMDDALRNDVVIMDNRSPNTIDLTAKKSKVYVYDGKIVLTLDNRITRTNVITIDLTTLKASLQPYRHPTLECSQTAAVSSNSYIYENHLYQMRVCPSEMTLCIRDLATGKIVQQWRAGRNEEIPFRNSVIYYEKETIWGDHNRELFRTSQFLRKVASGNAGLSVYPTADRLEVSVGGMKEIPQSLPGTIIVSNAAMTFAPYTMAMYNPTFLSYTAYTGRKSVYFKSRIHPRTFAHEPGEIRLNNNAFDRIHAFVASLKQDLTAKTVFRDNGLYFLAYYDEGKEKFYIRKFE